jgi:D-glycero-alpha-D-manno-heptose 1-phosphate guanylyltransferase
MEAVILAGGLGTRLSSVLKEVPKPMAPVGERPFLEFLLEWLTGYEISKIIMSVGYKSEIISSFFGIGFNGVPIEYSNEEEPLGTGGGVLKAVEKIEGNDFLVLNGDTYFPVNLHDFRKRHISMKGDITVALKEMHDFSRYGAVDIDMNNSIIRFHEKEFRKTGLINGGIYLINKDFITGLNLPERFSFEKDVLEKYTDRNIKGMVYQSQFIDIGIPEDYFKAQAVL